jgi:hypothetical protein
VSVFGCEVFTGPLPSNAVAIHVTVFIDFHMNYLSVCCVYEDGTNTNGIVLAAATAKRTVIWVVKQCFEEIQTFRENISSPSFEPKSKPSKKAVEELVYRLLQGVTTQKSVLSSILIVITFCEHDNEP